MSKKHFVIDMDYINDLAVNIAENVPEAYHQKFLIELNEYLKCASFEFENSDSESDLSEKNMKYLLMMKDFMNYPTAMLKIVMRLVKKKKIL